MVGAVRNIARKGLEMIAGLQAGEEGAFSVWFMRSMTQALALDEGGGWCVEGGRGGVIGVYWMRCGRCVFLDDVVRELGMKRVGGVKVRKRAVEVDLS